MLGRYDRAMRARGPQGGAPFTPRSIGAAVWYDPSDLSTLFQDSAGTTPVTAVGQQVGRMLDKSGRGNHATQATLTSRPILSARYNLLTKTEDFSDAVWVKSRSGTGVTPVVTPGYAPGPVANSLATRIQLDRGASNTSNDFSRLSNDAGTTATGILYKTSIWVKSNTGVDQTVSINISANTASTFVATPEWTQVFPVQVPMVTAGLNFRIETRGGFTTGQSVDVLIWGADLRAANDGAGLPSYQRVNTATDYDTVRFPYYLACDGVDDGMVTSAIDFTATDKVTFCAGLRKLSEAATSMVLELGNGTIQNRFHLTAPSTPNNYSFLSQGTGVQTAVVATGYPAPITNVVTGICDISGDRVTLRLNGSQVSQNTGDQGAGNYGNYPLYLFRRGGASLPFNGRMYGLAIIPSLLSAANLSKLETYMNRKTGAY